MGSGRERGGIAASSQVGFGQDGAVDPKVAEAMKKAAVAWLHVDGHAEYAVWCAWAEDGLQVVSGPGEQPAPGLATAEAAVVSARGDHGGLIVSWRAAVAQLQPGTDEWTELVPPLAAKRLNSSPAAELLEHWGQSCVVSRLTPLA
jgi:hypothetical protein